MGDSNDNNWPSSTDSKSYDPEGYERAQIVNLLCAVCAIAGLALAFAFFSAGNVAGGIVTFVLMVGGSLLVLQLVVGAHREAVDEAKLHEYRQGLETSSRTDKELRNLYGKVERLEASVKEAINNAVRTGDIIVSGPNAAVVVGSGSISIVSGLLKSDPELGKALQAVLGHIENVGNDRAARDMDRFTKELAKPEPDRNNLSDFWDNVVSAVPTIKNMTDIVATIVKVLS